MQKYKKYVNFIRILDDCEENKHNPSAHGILESTDVILSTNASAAHYQLLRFMKKKLTWDKFIVVIDEAGQSTEPLCWIPIRFASKVILAGDHMQLPPTVISQDALDKGLGISMFERLMKMKFRDGTKIPSHMLRIQYRMTPTIMEWCSKEMYNGELIASESSKKLNLQLSMKDILNEINNHILNVITSIDMIMIDTNGCNTSELGSNDHSKYNPGYIILYNSEINFVKIVLFILNNLKLEIGIISPYAAQVEHLKRDIKKVENSLKNLNIEIATVDGYQGREKDIVILSTVRSNDKMNAGFLSNKKRINVAITRARRLVIVVGDSSTICGDEFLFNLVSFISNHGKRLRIIVNEKGDGISIEELKN